MRKGQNAGYDLFLNKDVVLKAHSTTVIDTGVCLEFPDGYAGLITLRSSASKLGLLCPRPLIDSSYRGEIHSIIYNPTDNDIEYKAGDRLSSLFIFPVYQEPIEVVETLSETDRGSAWNGSSGGVGHVIK